MKIVAFKDSADARSYQNNCDAFDALELGTMINGKNFGNSVRHISIISRIDTVHLVTDDTALAAYIATSYPYLCYVHLVKREFLNTFVEYEIPTYSESAYRYGSRYGLRIKRDSVLNKGKRWFL